MTQLRLGLTLADRVAAWAAVNECAKFYELCEAMDATAGDVDIAAREVGALRWVDGKGYEVCAPLRREETI